MLAVMGAVGGWYALKWTNPWLDILRSFSGEALKSEIALEARWVLPFEEGGQFLYAHVARGERLIVSTSTTTQAQNMRDGKIVWANDDLAGSSIQMFSEDEPLPLLMLNRGDHEYPILLNIDSESGEIIWERQLETREPSLTYGSGTILVYDLNRLYAYSHDNRLLRIINNLHPPGIHLQTLFLQAHLIFIPTYQHVGAYSIPEQVEQLQNQSN